MKSVNYKLREAYVTAFAGFAVNAITVPIFYLELPQGEEVDNYIILSEVGNSESGTMDRHGTDITMQLAVYTVQQYGNSGKFADEICNAIFQLIYPTPTSVLSFGSDFQMVGMKLTRDSSENLSTEGNDYFANRLLTFEHKIFIK